MRNHSDNSATGLSRRHILLYTWRSAVRKYQVARAATAVALGSYIPGTLCNGCAEQSTRLQNHSTALRTVSSRRQTLFLCFLLYVTQHGWKVASSVVCLIHQVLGIADVLSKFHKPSGSHRQCYVLFHREDRPIFVHLLYLNAATLSNTTGEGDGDRGSLDEGERETSVPEPGKPVPSGPEIPAQEYTTGAAKSFVLVSIRT